MIVEIALGIVLAVLILAYLPEILALGMLALGVVLLFVVLAVAFYFLFTAPEIALAALAVAAMLGTAMFFQAQNGPIASKMKRAGEIFGYGLLVLLVVGIAVLGAIAVHEETVPLFVVLALVLGAVVALIKAYNDVFGLSPSHRRFLEKIFLGIKWLPANNAPQSDRRDEATRATGHER